MYDLYINFVINKLISSLLEVSKILDNILLFKEEIELNKLFNSSFSFDLFIELWFIYKSSKFLLIFNQDNFKNSFNFSITFLFLIFFLIFSENL